MMKRLKKWTALYLVMCMLLVLCAGCGSDADENDGSLNGSVGQENVNGSTGSDTAKPDSADGPLVPYEDTLTVTLVKSDPEAVTYLEGEGPEHNFITDFYKDKLNIEYKILWNSTDYTTKLNLDIASNELPDMFMVDASQLNTLIENGQIEDLTGYFDDYTSDILKKQLEYDDGLLLQGCTVDGSIYGIPRPLGLLDCTTFMWIRTDWMEQLGLSVPTTWQEFWDYVKALKESGLCAFGSSGLNFSSEQGGYDVGINNDAFNAIAQMFGAYLGFFVEDEATGELVYSPVTENMRNALLAMQDMYKAGLIDADWTSKGQTQAELIASGAYGITFGNWAMPYYLVGSMSNDSNSKWECYPLPSYDSTEKSHPKAAVPCGGYFVVRKGFEHPESLFKTVNLWLELNCAGGQYVDWWVDKISGDYSTQSLVGNYYPFTMEGITTASDIAKGLNAAYASDNPDEEIQKYPIATFTYGNIKDWDGESPTMGFINYMAYVRCAGEVYPAYEERGLQYNLFQGILSEEAQFNNSILGTTLTETFVNIIMDVEPIETFDSFVEQWYEQGGEEITKEVNEWYSSH